MKRSIPFLLRSAATCAVLLMPHALLAADDGGQTRERFRILWHGQTIDYVEEGDYAITEGDIILGPKAALRRAREAAESGGVDGHKALTLDASWRLWQRAPSGLVEVPYTIDAGSETNIQGAVDEINRVLAGVLRMTTRLAADLFIEITPNLQKFVAGRSRPRPIRVKPHKAHAYKTVS